MVAARTNGQMRTLFIGTGWKMNKTVAEAWEFVEELNAYTSFPDGIQPFILPPHTALTTVHQALDPATGVWIGAQNAHWMPAGAYTGEVSMQMARDAGAVMVEIGHSERRALFNETDHTVNLKLRAALDTGLIPLLCVGEGVDVRDVGRAVDFVSTQVEVALAGVDDDGRRQVLVAYEPVWAIGDDGVAASPDHIASVATAIASEFGIRATVYGGSVTADNAAELLETGGIDGLFVGRAAWHARGLLDLIEIAAGVREGKR